MRLSTLDGQVLVVDPEGGHWVRFVVTRAQVLPEKPHGIDYSLTLNGANGERCWSASATRIQSRGRSATSHGTIVIGFGASGPTSIGTRYCLPTSGGHGRDVARERSDPMTTLKAGIASYEEMKARTTAVARGERRVSTDEPMVWFTSTESFAKVLSAGNRELLSVIAEKAPGSLDELARITGKAKSNLSRTLRTMEGYGLVRLERGERGRITPKVIHDRVELDLPLTLSRTAS
jgi:predicted transcriptional regulator